MSIAEQILDTVRGLPSDKQQELLDFAEFLKAKSPGKPPLRGVVGLCADLGVHITEADIDEARQEMRGTFPREDI